MSNGNLERMESFLIAFLSLQNTCCRIPLESKRTCKKHSSLEPNTDYQNLLGFCLEYLTNVLDESCTRSSLIPLAVRMKFGGQSLLSTDGPRLSVGHST